VEPADDYEKSRKRCLKSVNCQILEEKITALVSKVLTSDKIIPWVRTTELLRTRLSKITASFQGKNCQFPPRTGSEENHTN